MRLYKKAQQFGEPTDAIDSIPAIFTFVLLVMVIFLSLFHVNEELQSDPNMSSIAQEASQKIVDKYPRPLDYGAVALYIFMCIGSCIIASKINRHPVYVVMSIITLVIAVVIAMFTSMIYDRLRVNTSVLIFSSRFPIVTWMFNNIVYLVIGYVILVSIFLFMKPDG